MGVGILGLATAGALVATARCPSNPNPPCGENLFGGIVAAVIAGVSFLTGCGLLIGGSLSSHHEIKPGNPDTTYVGADGALHF